MRLTILLLLLIPCLHAQNSASTCYFGTAALDFRTFPPTPIMSSAMEGKEAPASICDANGDVLFYSNGGDSWTSIVTAGNIWNKTNQVMENGDLQNLGGCFSSYAGSVIIPMNVSTKKSGESNYMLITNDCLESNFSGSDHSNAGFRYCLIDMSENGGQGKVMLKDQLIYPYSNHGSFSTNHEPIAAVISSNNESYWLFGYSNDSIFSLRINETGISNFSTFFLSERSIVVSPSHDFLVTNDQLCSFDWSTGEITKILTIGSNQAAFSSNGKVLYVNENGSLFQYDLTSFNILSTKLFIAQISTQVNPVLAGDYRIYFYVPNSSSFPGYIACPNTLGQSCNSVLSSISLGGKNSGSQFTNIPANLLFSHQDNCILNTNILKEEKPIIFPSITDGTVTILFKEMDFRSAIVYDQFGKKILEDNWNELEHQISLNGKASGMYYLMITSKNESNSNTINFKIVKY